MKSNKFEPCAILPYGISPYDMPPYDVPHQPKVGDHFDCGDCVVKIVSVLSDGVDYHVVHAKTHEIQSMSTSEFCEFCAPYPM